jgi:hypothetical protein
VSRPRPRLQGYSAGGARAARGAAIRRPARARAGPRGMGWGQRRGARGVARAAAGASHVGVRPGEGAGFGAGAWCEARGQVLSSDQNRPRFGQTRPPAARGSSWAHGYTPRCHAPRQGVGGGGGRGGVARGAGRGAGPPRGTKTPGAPGAGGAESRSRGGHAAGTWPRGAAGRVLFVRSVPGGGGHRAGLGVGPFAMGGARPRGARAGRVLGRGRGPTIS